VKTFHHSWFGSDIGTDSNFDTVRNLERSLRGSAKTTGMNAMRIWHGASFGLGRRETLPDDGPPAQKKLWSYRSGSA